MKENAVYAPENLSKKHCHRLIALLFTFIFVFSLFTLNSPAVFAASVKAPTMQSVTAKSATSIAVKWKKVSGAKGYVVYQKKGSGEYKKIAIVKGGSTVSYTKKNLSAATKYSYKIKAFKTGGKTTYSAYSKVKYTYTKPTTPTITNVKAISGTAIKVSWKKVSRAKGYVVYQKNGSNYKKVANVKSGSTTSYTVRGLKSGQKYTFIVRSYFKANNKTIHSAKSASKAAKTTVKESMVWIPTKGGTKYHIHSGCSNMDDPAYVTKTEAINLGFGSCGRCW